MGMLLLRTPVQHYAWGRVDGLVDLVGSVPSGGPEAELWVGTHPGAPAVVEPTGVTLAATLAVVPSVPVAGLALILGRVA